MSSICEPKKSCMSLKAEEKLWNLHPKSGALLCTHLGINSVTLEEWPKPADILLPKL